LFVRSDYGNIACFMKETKVNSLIIFLIFLFHAVPINQQPANSRNLSTEQITTSTMGGRGNPHLPEKKKIAQCFLRASFEQGGIEGLSKVKPADCWAAHPSELPKGNYTISAWGSLFNRIKKEAEQEANSSGQLSSFPQYAAENLPDCFKSGGGAGAGGASGGGTGAGSTGAGSAGAGTGAGVNGTGAKSGSPDKKGKFINCQAVGRCR
jgi:hypothetical protein